MKFIKIIKLIFKIIFNLVFAGIAFFLLFNLAFLFGHEILDGVLVGNDSAFALSLIYWFERFYPRIPLWYPLQGAGVSLFHSYPMLTTFLAILIKNITHLSSIEVFRILSFSTFPLTAFGVYVFAKRKVGNPAAAFFSGVFFLLSQASWIFQRLHGIFAQSFSMVFVPWSFLFFDVFLEKRLKHAKSNFTSRLNLILAVIFTALTFLAHPVTGMVVSMSLLTYAFFYGQFSLKLKSGIKQRLERLFKSLTLVGFCLVLSVCLAGFWLIPFRSYNKLANREGLLEMNIGQLKEVSLKLETLAGFGDFAVGDLRYDYFFFALPVILLSAVGLLGGLLSSSSLLAWTLIAFGAAIFTSLPLYLPTFVEIFNYIFTAVYFRALIVVIVLLPIAAGFGAFFIGDFPFLIGGFFGKKFIKRRDFPGLKVIRLVFGALRFAVVSLVVLFVCFFFIIRFEHRPPDKATQEHPAYGITSFKAYGPTLGEDMEILKKDWQSVFLTKPEIKVNKQGLYAAPSLVGFIEDFSLDKTSRVDVSAFSGENFLQYAPMLTEANFVNLYHYSASIIHRMWGYQQGVFYGSEPLYDNPELLKELSYWFGIEYTTIVPGHDRKENYKKTGWELVKPGGTRDNPLPVYHFPEAEGLLTVSKRPTALVIGSLKDAAYDQVFRSSNAGVFSYNDLWLVEGSERLDDYSLKELSKFDVLILHGYGYKNKSAAWRLMRNFIEKGGKVFIDTGWQYVAKDWGKKSGQLSLPEPAPIEKTSWGNASREWKDFEIDPMLGKFETDFFKPFSWEGEAWGGAFAKENSLRKDAKVLIKDQDRVMMAMADFGKGKIIWSGLNLFSHAQGPEGEKEIGVLKAVFDLLIPAKNSPTGEYSGGQGPDALAVSWQRDYPDELVIEFNQDSDEQWLLWKEAFSPNWKAELVTSYQLPATSLQIYRGGPGFVLIKLPKIKAGDKLYLEYGLRFFEGVGAKALSVLTVVGLVIYLFIGGRIEALAGKYAGRIRIKKKKILGDEEEDY